MSKETMKRMHKNSIRIMRSQMRYTPSSIDMENMRWSEEVEYPVPEFCFLRLGVLLAKHIGCDFSAPTQNFERFGKKGRFYGIEHDIKLAVRMYKAYSHLVMDSSDQYRMFLLSEAGKVETSEKLVQEYRRKLIEVMGGMQHDLRIKSRNDPELEAYRRVSARQYKSNINMMYALMDERREKEIASRS